jgi:hypothetical protein
MAQKTSPLDTPILWLSKLDVLRLRDLIEGGTLITGGLGSGKSSTSLRQLCCGLMRAGLGALVCTVKSSDAESFIAYAKECGREKDVIHFHEKSGLKFDPLAYESSRTAERGSTNLESLIDFCSILMSIGKFQNASNNEKFWEQSGEQALRHSARIHQLAGRPVSIVDLNRALQSFPTHPGEHEEEAWQRESYCAQLINEIRLRKDQLSEDDWADLDVATQYIFSRWANYDPRPRGSIELTVASMSDRFCFQPMRKIFAGGAFSFTPEETTHNRKLVIVDFPILQYGKEAARLIQILVKVTFQRSWLRHKFKPGCCNGAMLVQDEFQFLNSTFENHFVQVCRDSCIAPLYATQSVMGLAEENGEAQPGSKTKGFLNNISVRLAHNSTCPDTAQWLADMLGREYKYLDNFNAGGNPTSNNGSVGGSQQLAHILEPIEFSRLLKPDADNPFAEVICYRSGRIFGLLSEKCN